MKILSFLILLLAFANSAFSQSVLPLRGDTIVIEKVGGNADLRLKNTTRDSTGGVAYNLVGGVIRFKKTRKINDTSFVIGGDTIRISSVSKNISNSSLSANGDYSQQWNGKQLSFDSISTVTIVSRGTSFNRRNINTLSMQSGNLLAAPISLQSIIRKVDNSADSITSSIDLFGFFNTARTRVYNNITNNNSAVSVSDQVALISSSNIFDVKSGNVNVTKNQVEIFANDSVRVGGFARVASSDSVVVPIFSSYDGSHYKYKLAIAPMGGGGSSIDTTSISNRINSKKDIQRHYGTIFNDNSWTTIDNLTVNGATASVVSNKIDVSGGAGNYTQTLDVPGGTLLERWKISGKFKATEKSGTSYGFGVGIRSINSWATLNSAARFDATSSSNGIVSLQNSGVDKIVTSALGFTANDYIVLTVERNVDLFTVTAKNVNTGATVTGTYLCDPTSSPALHNSGTFSVFSYGGTFTLDSLNVTSKEVANTPLFIFGDSKTQLAGTGVNFTNRYASTLSSDFGPVIISAGSSDRSVEWVLRTDETIALHPRAVLICAPSNDPRSGVSGSVTNANLDTLYNRFTRAGIRVKFLLPFPENTSGSGVSQAAIRTHMTSSPYTSNDYIDTETPLLACTNCISDDDVHPNVNAQPIIENSIIESFKLDDVEIGGDVAILSKENKFSERQTITGDFTAKPAFEANSFIVQPYGVNNILQGDNFRYNAAGGGSGFKRKYDGYSSVWYQQNGTHIFQTAGTSTAGTDITYLTRFKIFNNGNLGNSDTDPGYPLGINGQIACLTNTGGPSGLIINNSGGGEAAIYMTGVSKKIASNGNYLSLDAETGHPIYLGFNTTSNAGNTVNVFNGRATFGNDGTLYIGRTTKYGNETFSNNGYSYFHDTASLRRPFSYISNVHSFFTPYSLVDKWYVDSVVAAISTSDSAIWKNSGQFVTSTNIKGGVSHQFSLQLGGDGATSSSNKLSRFEVNADSIVMRSYGRNSSFGTLRVSTSTKVDADATVILGEFDIELPQITANRTLTLPTGLDGDRLVISNKNSSGFSWSFAVAVKDKADADVTTIANDSVYWLIWKNSRWEIRMLY